MNLFEKYKQFFEDEVSNCIETNIKCDYYHILLQQNECCVVCGFYFGVVLKWLKRYAWKAYSGVKASVGSNPTHSVNTIIICK